MELEGAVIYHQEGNLPDPKGPIDPPARMNEASAAPGEKARVSVTVQRAAAYGEVKCSFTLSVSCPQTETWMNYAAEHIFYQATQYVNSGMSRLAPDVPLFNVPPPSSP